MNLTLQEAFGGFRNFQLLQTPFQEECSQISQRPLLARSQCD